MASRILVVDDEPDLELLITQKFRRQIRAGDYEFVFAQNGQQAYDILLTDSGIDIVLTDINMPVMDGLTLLSKLAELQLLTKAVIVSAYGDLGNIRTAMNRGAFDFITKPIDFQDLEITLERTASQLGVSRRALEDHSQLMALRRELNIASNIQQSILPQTFPSQPAKVGVDIFARMTPALQVGGDFYDFFTIAPGRCGLVIGDVSGKGVSAALFMAVSRTLIRATGLTNVSAAECVRYVNRMLAAENPSSMFVTALYCVLDTATGSLEICNAGHNLPIHVAGGNAQFIKAPQNLVLGVDDDFDFESYQTVLQPGDTVLFYTDGVTEAENPDGDMLGNDRLLAAMATQGGVPAREVIGHVFDEVTVFAAGAAQNDDLTALALKYLGTAP